MQSVAMFVQFLIWSAGMWRLSPVASAIACLAGLGALDARFRRTSPYTRRELLLLVPFIVPFLVLLYAVWFRYDGAPAEVVLFRWNALHCVLVGQLLFSLGLVIGLRGCRLEAFLWAIFQLWMTFSTVLVAIMSVTNIWL